MDNVKVYKEDIFLVDVSDLECGAKELLYAPRLGVSQLLEYNDDIDNIIAQIQSEVKTPTGIRNINDLRKMSILPNHRCNFNCSYCYAALGRNTDELDIETTEQSLRFFLDAERNNKPLSVAILGGGEPMLSWDTTEYAIKRTREIADEQGLSVELTVVTNGSIIDDTRIEVFKRNDVVVNVSFDLIAEVQEEQRSSYNLVRDNIIKMINRGVYVVMNSTITPSNVRLMPEMVELAHNLFKGLKFMIFEPVIATQLFASANDLKGFYDDYLLYFPKAMQKAEELGLDITCRIMKSIDNCSERGCDGRFNLCPNGDITACYCTASKNDPNFEARLYGKVSEEGVKIDTDKFEVICNENVFSFDKCKDCFVKYNCAGGCMLPNDRYNDEYLYELCEFNKEFIRREIVRRLKK